MTMGEGSAVLSVKNIDDQLPFGMVTTRSSASVDVDLYIDGEFARTISLGYTEQFHLWPGSHQIQIREKISHIPLTEEVKIFIEAGQQLNFATGVSTGAGKPFLIALVSLWLLMILSNAIPQLKLVFLLAAPLTFFAFMYRRKQARPVRHLHEVDYKLHLS